jgi:hypothetical protein
MTTKEMMLLTKPQNLHILFSLIHNNRHQRRPRRDSLKQVFQVQFVTV